MSFKVGVTTAVDSALHQRISIALSVDVRCQTLDDTWRQVISHFGGDPDALVDKDHDTLCAEFKR